MKLIAIELVKELSDFPPAIFTALVLFFGFYTFSNAIALAPARRHVSFHFPRAVSFYFRTASGWRLRKVSFGLWRSGRAWWLKRFLNGRPGIAGLLKNTNLGRRTPPSYLLLFTLPTATPWAAQVHWSATPTPLYEPEYHWDADFGRVKRFCDL